MDPGQGRFVGRIYERWVLDRLVSDAARGEPRLALITGEAGIGKTALLRAALTAASAAGATVLAGTGVEDADVPYLAIAGVLGSIVGRDPRGAGRVALPSSSTPDDGWESARLDMYLAVTDALAAACDEAPVVLALDDAQWADRASRDLLAHLVASRLLAPVAGRHAALFLLAHRPQPDGTADPFLERLRRNPAAVEIPLRGFAAAEAHPFIHDRTGRSAAPALLNDLLEVTGGNPLLLGGFLERRLAGGGLEVDGVGRWRAPSAGAGGRDAAAHLGVDADTGADLDSDAQARLAALSVDVIAVLEVAAVLGSSSRVDVLATTVGAPVDDALAAATAAGVLEVDGDRLRFVHDHARRQLLRSVAPGRRPELHRRIADVLEERLGRDAPAATVARHLERGGIGGERLVRRARQAGHDAFGTGAWHEALHFYEVALSVAAEPPAGVGDDDGATGSEVDAGTDGTADAGADGVGADDVDLRLRAGVAAFWANDVVAAGAHLAAAADGARRRGDVGTWGEAELTRARLTFMAAAPEAHGPTALAELLATAVDDPELRAHVLATQADLAYGRLAFGEAEELARLAVAAAPTEGRAAALAATSLGVALLAVLELDEAEATLARAAALAARAGDHHVRTSVDARRALLAVVRGAPAGVEAIVPALLAEQQRRGFWLDAQVSLGAALAADIARGRFDEAIRRAAETELLHDWTPYAFAPGMFFPAAAFAQAVRGDIDGAHRVIARWAALGGRGTWRYSQLVMTLVGDTTAVRRDVERRPWPAPPKTVDLFSVDVLAAQVEVGAAIGDRGMVESALGPLTATAERGVRSTLGWPTALARAIGIGLATCGDDDGARRWLSVAHDDARRAGAVVEAARTMLALADLDVTRGTAGAGAALAAAAARLDELGMLALAVRARDHRGAGRSAGPPRLRAVFCSDLVGSTALNVQAGDERYVALLAEHDHIMRNRLRAHGGVEFKHTGDGFCAWFADPVAALRCGLGVQEDLARWTVLHPDRELRARVGIALGSPLERGDDLFGVTVALATRLCEAARTGTVLVTEEVAAATSDTGLALVPVGPRHLRGFPAPVDGFELAPAPAPVG